MAMKPDRPPLSVSLRQEAEARLKQQQAGSGLRPSAPDTQRLLHELQVHQVELTMQNDELLLVRRKLENALFQYTELYELAPVGYFTLARDGAIRRVNLAGAALLGLECASVVNRRFGLFVSEDMRLEFAAFIDKVFSGQTQEACEICLRRKLHSPLWAHLEAKVSQDAQECFAAVVDITERKKTEDGQTLAKDYLANIINAIGDPVYVKDEVLKFALVNDALCASLGKGREELIATTGMECLPPGPLAHLLEADQRVLSTGVEDLCREVLTGHDGKVRTIITRKTRYVDLKGARFIVAVIRDVTEHDALEAQLRTAQKMEAIGSLAGGVAHDFNNLLSVILSCTGFALEAASEGGSVLDDLKEIEKAAERAATLTRQLLAFSRKQILQPVPLNLNKTATELEKMLMRILGEDIEFVLSLAPELGVVCADPGQVEQVIMNLVVNARDAMPTGGKLLIATSNSEIDERRAASHIEVAPGSYVQLAITDTGEGMNEQTRARIFDPFFTTKEKDKGTGLGLSTVHGIIRQSDGYIWVDSELGHGTTFTILLPRVIPETARATRPLAVLPRTTGSETILVVDDEEALRKVVSRALDAAGYNVLVAQAGDEALRLSAQHAGEIHLLLTDVVMPRMSGRALAEELVKSRPNVAILYMSGYTDDAIVHHGALDVETRFIGKPFTAAELVLKVGVILDEGKAALVAEQQ